MEGLKDLILLQEVSKDDLKELVKAKENLGLLDVATTLSRRIYKEKTKQRLFLEVCCLLEQTEKSNENSFVKCVYNSMYGINGYSYFQQDIIIIIKETFSEYQEQCEYLLNRF